jgi:nucleotide-binding universal stress UspA family protein
MFKTILVALDGSERSNGAIRLAESAASGPSAKFVVVHVRELLAGRGAGPRHLDEEARAATVHEQAEILRSHGFEVTERMYSTFKRPAELIVRVARRSHADLIVTGLAQHRSLLGAAFTAATPYALVHRAPCPVLVAPDVAREAAPAAPALAA